MKQRTTKHFEGSAEEAGKSIGHSDHNVIGSLWLAVNANWFDSEARGNLIG